MPARTPSPRDRVARFLPAVALSIGLVLSVFLAYGQVARHGFVRWDDYVYVVENPEVRSGLSVQGVSWALTTSRASNWHPLTWLSHMADVELFGLWAGGHHLVNVGLHAACAVLLLAVLLNMTGDLWPSALAAFLFALHPLRVESVAWISERKDVLSGLLAMSTLLAWHRYVRNPGVARYLLVVLAFAAGLMAKPMLVTLPVLLLLLDVWPLGRWRPGGAAPGAIPLTRLVREKLPLFALSAASSAVTLAMQRAGGALGTLEHLPLPVRLSNAAVGYVFYLWRTVWPVDLACFYPHPFRIVPAAVPAALLIAVVSGLAWRSIGRHPYLFTGWLWYLTTLLPVIGIFQVGMQAWADRYAYLPLVGVYIAVAWGAREFVARAPRGRIPVVVAAILALLAAIFVTHRQVGVWSDTIRLFEHAVAVTRDNDLMHNNLGIEYRRAGDLARAEAQYLEALRIRPDSDSARYNLGNLFLARDDLGKAASEFRAALAANPEHAHAHQNLGVILQRQGDLPGAAHHLREAVRIRPDYVEALVNLGIVCAKQGRLVEAVTFLERALALEPSHAVARETLGRVRARLESGR